jgi:hypothetical protein
LARSPEDNLQAPAAGWRRKAWFFLVLLLLVIGVGIGCLVYSIRSHADFRLLDCKFSFGRVHKMYKGAPAMAKLQEALSRFYPRIKPPDEYSWPTSAPTWVFIARYTGSLPFAQLSRVNAELRNEAGKVLPLRQKAFGNILRHGSQQRDYHSIWILDSGQTNLLGYRLCLCVGSNSVPLAEAKISQ